jgi:hypothetical protein
MTSTKGFRMQKFGLFFLFLAVIFLFAGCRSSKNEMPVTDVIVTPTGQPGSPIPTSTPLVFKTSEPGFVSVKGKLWVVNPLGMLPDPNDAIYLVPLSDDESGVSAIPSIMSEGVYGAEVDEITGEFMLTNIKPGQYAIVVLEKSGSEVPARMLKSDSIAIVTLMDADINQTIDLGYLRFP